MATRSVEWSSVTKLACSQCLPADVILCIRPELLPLLTTDGGSPPLALASDELLRIPENPPISHQPTTLAATLTAVTTALSCTCDGNYRYTFEYDDALLVEGTELICSDITGAICDSCLLDVVRDLIWAALFDFYEQT